jgi:hypothetical protein
VIRSDVLAVIVITKDCINGLRKDPRHSGQETVDCLRRIGTLKWRARPCGLLSDWLGRTRISFNPNQKQFARSVHLAKKDIPEERNDSNAQAITENVPGVTEAQINDVLIDSICHIIVIIQSVPSSQSRQNGVEVAVSTIDPSIRIELDEVVGVNDVVSNNGVEEKFANRADDQVQNGVH